MAISKAKVLDIKEHGAEIKEYTLKLEKNYYFEAGAFLLLTLEQKDDYTRWPDSRNFSIASAYNNEGLIRLIIRKVGYYTNRIFNELTIGSECMIKYAYGDFLLPFFDKTAPVYCIAGGTGIAPILGFAEQLKQQSDSSKLHVFYSFKNKEEQPGMEVLKQIVPESQLHLFCTRENIEGTLNRRINTSDLSEADFEKGHFYICGNEAFTKEFVNYLKTKNAINVYTDEW